MSIDSKLLSLIDSSVNGILWLTKDSIAEQTHIHETLDYLVDGRLYQFLNQMNIKEPNFENNDFSFFISKSFDQPFFLIHKKGQIDLKKDTGTIKSIFESNTDLKEISLFVIGSDQPNLISSFEKGGIKAQSYSSNE